MRGKQLLSCGAALALGLTASISTGVFATTTSTVDDYAGLKACLEQAEATCTLAGDIVATNNLTVSGKVTLNLEDHVISTSYDSFTGSANGGIITVLHGADLTINGSDTGAIRTGSDAPTELGNVYGAIRFTSKDDTDETKPAVLTVNGGTLEGFYYGVVGSGNSGRGNTKLYINGGTIKGFKEDDCFGIYQPQTGDIEITGGLVSGASGILMKSGSLVMTGGTIEGVGADARPNQGSNNGGFASGAGLQIESNKGYTGKINVLLNGGKIVAKKGIGIYEYLVKGAPVTSLESLIIAESNISGAEGFQEVTGFNLIDNIATGSTATSTDTTNLVVTKVSGVENLPEDYTLSIDEITGEGIEEDLEKVAALDEKLNIGTIFSIILRDGEKEVKTEAGEEIEFAFAIPDELKDVPEGYTRKFYMIRVHDGEAEILASTTGDVIEFSSKYFSTYVIAYEDTADIKAPDTGKGAVSATIASSVAAAVVASTLVSTAYAVSRAKRQ